MYLQFFLYLQQRQEKGGNLSVEGQQVRNVPSGGQ